VPEEQCDISGFALVGEYCEYDSLEEVLYYSALTDLLEPTDELAVEIWEAFDDPTSPGIYPITDDGYDVCSLCVAIFTNLGKGSGAKANRYARKVK
jgi:hypothetical protein